MVRKKIPRYLLQDNNRFALNIGIAPRVRIETRIDVMLYRLNFIPNIWDGRRLIRNKLAYIMTPRHSIQHSFSTLWKHLNLRRKFYYYYVARKYFHSVALLNAISVQLSFALQRKN